MLFFPDTSDEESRLIEMKNDRPITDLLSDRPSFCVLKWLASFLLLKANFTISNQSFRST